MSQTQVTVVGAGVVGLSCAVRLAEAGYEVDVLARDLPRETTSAVAGGLWMPYLAAPLDRVAGWAISAFRHFEELRDTPEAGVRFMTGVLATLQHEPPAWALPLKSVAPLTRVQDPFPGRTHGFEATVPLVDTPRYLMLLTKRLEAAGGTLTRISLPELPEPKDGNVVVNATGLSARGLVPDDSVHPVRGQILHLADPGLTRWYDLEFADGSMTYVFPHGKHVVIGGNAIDGEWSRAADAAEADRILARAIEWVPELKGLPVLGHRVGLRPARPEVRLETVVRPDGVLVHCYGHGGSGITLGWGCAGEVLESVRARIGPGEPSLLKSR